MIILQEIKPHDLGIASIKTFKIKSSYNTIYNIHIYINMFFLKVYCFYPIIFYSVIFCELYWIQFCSICIITYT